MIFAGIEFKNPIVVASSPLTSKLKWLVEAEKHGAAGVSTKLTFVRQPFYGKLRMSCRPKQYSLICYDRRLDMHDGFRLVEDAKRNTNLVIFANLTHDNEDMDGWAMLAKGFEDAGADLIEANLICPNVGLSTKSIKGTEGLVKGEYGGAIAGQNPEKVKQVIQTIKEVCKIPVVAKLTPNVSDIGEIALACKLAGVDGVCLAGGQSALPKVDIYNYGKPDYALLNNVSHSSLGGPACLTMGFSHVAQVYKKTGLQVIGGGGIERFDECLMMMMWGATLVTMCTSIMWNGWEVVSKALEGMEKYLRDMKTTYEEIIGLSIPYLRSSSKLDALDGYPVVDLAKCIGCGQCTKPGHCDAVEMQGKHPIFDPSKCLGCGICVQLCPTKALKMTAP